MYVLQGKVKGMWDWCHSCERTKCFEQAGKLEWCYSSSLYKMLEKFLCSARSSCWEN